MCQWSMVIGHSTFYVRSTSYVRHSTFVRPAPPCLVTCSTSDFVHSTFDIRRLPAWLRRASSHASLLTSSFCILTSNFPFVSSRLRGESPQIVNRNSYIVNFSLCLAERLFFDGHEWGAGVGLAGDRHAHVGRLVTEIPLGGGFRRAGTAREDRQTTGHDYQSCSEPHDGRDVHRTCRGVKANEGAAPPRIGNEPLLC